MKQEEWNEGLNHIDDALVEEHIAKKEELKKKTIWIRVGAIAASLALVLGIAAVLESNYLPSWEDAQYSAEEVAGLFEGNWMDAGTKAYQRVYARDIDHLEIGSAPKGIYLNVYQILNMQEDLDKTELEGLAKQIIPKVADSLGQAEPQYGIEESDDIYGKRYSVELKMGDYYFEIYQGSRAYSCWLNKSTHSDRRIVLDGVPVQIDQRLSNEEILDSVQPIKEKLFDLFGVSFSDMKIWRDYWSGAEHGADAVYIFFYDEDAHYLNAFNKEPLSDYIYIRFDNHANFEGDLVSDSILQVADIHYYKYRVSVDESYTLVAKAKKISVREAEKLLYKGYVFGGHSCPTCMAMNPEVDFKNYDYVGFEYQSGTIRGRTILIPFYTFYKEINTPRNGVKSYAKTYVPAIEISGYEEYFESQKDKHH